MFHIGHSVHDNCCNYKQVYIICNNTFLLPYKIYNYGSHENRNIHFSQYSTRKIPPPKPFFTGQTWVEDFYEGELYYALLKATKYDVIFLMLYAPWDADSQNARSEFETACRYFHKKASSSKISILPLLSKISF